MLATKLQKVLKDNSFTIKHMDSIENLGLVYYTNNEKYVFVYYIKEDVFMDIDEISFKLREILIKEKVNIWNTYLIICVESKTFIEDIINIERNSKYLRKYVVKELLDIQRIYFLDNTISNSEYIENNVVASMNIRNIINKMKDEYGDIKKLSDLEIKSIADELIAEVDESYDN
ncbi:ABC-three component system middle component 1 [Paraclostridium sordellii]|uniref:ABC-three component system middle component 1 n=1 Tax=Paraclostridium sordellii TaxID=1505 RepID=UPI0030D4E7E7